MTLAKTIRRHLFLSTVCLFGSEVAAADLTPISAFARLPAIRSVSISPDGKYISLISGQLGREAVMVVPVDNLKATPKLVAASDPKGYAVSWCRWATDVRLLCGLRIATQKYAMTHFETRLVAVNADGSDQRVLLQDTFAATQSNNTTILDWTPEERDNVLILLGGNQKGPSVFSMNVSNGGTKVIENAHEHMYDYTTDGRGHVRLAWGIKEDDENAYFYAKPEGTSQWKELLKVKGFDGTEQLIPFAIDKGNIAYATGGYNGRNALWKLDLTDTKKPELLFSNEAVDTSNILLAEDHRLVALRYDDGLPRVQYFDEQQAAIMNSVDAALPHTFNIVASHTRDWKKQIIFATSDVEAGTFQLFDVEKGDLRALASSYPELNRATLAHVRPIKYRAADGTIIPGYITIPAGVKPRNLPLIVMPHGGPVSRDYWRFDFLAQFLASRGYAVLQMNYRGSDGYGWKWYHDAHQDWGGLTYSDIADGARWALNEGIADPQRTCIVGWSFGGYAALLGAARNSDLFRCSVSIAGLSDLVELKKYLEFFEISRTYTAGMLGTNVDKLRADSPRLHAENVQMPVLMIHGDMDAQVDVSHSKMMDSALNRYKKPHKLVLIDGADHQMSRESDRITLLTEIEKFLQENIGEKK
jgi:dipeptidyl aminopeptidase/acylaminoacyl peptidase